MDVVMLSRLQFAAATMFHFLFVPLTLGLSVLVAYMETQYVRTGDETYLRMTKFWGKMFLINFALGVVTGLVLAISVLIFPQLSLEQNPFLKDGISFSVGLAGASSSKPKPPTNIGEVPTRRDPTSTSRARSDSVHGRSAGRPAIQATVS